MTLGAVLVAHGQLTATTVPVLTLLAMASFVPVSEIAVLAKSSRMRLASARRIFTVETNRSPCKMAAGRAVTCRPGHSEPVLCYEEVGFTYVPGDPPPYVR